MEFIINQTNEEKYSVDCIVDGEKLGEISWKEENGLMHIDHTFVSDQLRGQGVAKKLLDQAAQYARQNDLKIVAICSYVQGAFAKSSEYEDVEAKK